MGARPTYAAFLDLFALRRCTVISEAQFWLGAAYEQGWMARLIFRRR